MTQTFKVILGPIGFDGLVEFEEACRGAAGHVKSGKSRNASNVVSFCKKAASKVAEFIAPKGAMELRLAA